MFDVFAYHSSDRNAILDICRILRSLGVCPWVDIEQLRPGAWVQQEIQSAIHTTRCAMICVGTHGLGPWQTVEVQAMVDRCVAGEVRLIPVLLRGLDVLPEDLLFLRPLNFVCFERSVFEAEPLRLLTWGITGELIPPSRVGVAVERSAQTDDADRAVRLGNSVLVGPSVHEAADVAVAEVLCGVNGDHDTESPR